MTWLLLVLGAAAGGFVNGLAGFGTALFALGFWLQFLPPEQAVAIVVVVSTVTGMQGLWVVRRAIFFNPLRLARFLIPGLFGIPLGVAVLALIEPWALKVVIAGFMLLYGGFFTLRRNLPQIDRPTPFADAAIGLAGGVLGGAASLSGALPTMWCAMRNWPKSETRAVLQPYNVAVLGLTALALALRGTYTPSVLALLAVAVPVAVLSAQLGIFVFKRLRDDQFRRLIVGLMFVSGVLLILRELV